MVKNLPAMQETWVGSLGREDSLEKEMTTHSCVLAWRIPWTEEPGRIPFLSTNNTKVHPQDYKHKCPGGHYFPKQSPYDCPKQPVTVIRLDTVSKVLWNSSIHQLRLYVVSDLK